MRLPPPPLECCQSHTGSMGSLLARYDTFRNDFAAHRIVATSYPITPKMDTALLVATTYDQWIRESLNAVFDEPSLEKRYDRVIRTSKKFLKQLIAFGPTVDQEHEGRVPNSTSK